ncbi:MAG TPA: AsnC family transcriptional regulator [Nitrososphaeraceae archaeon]|nr:AsnC family transcriptional regulator [Nitrososphaeraceae archaeon]
MPLQLDDYDVSIIRSLLKDGRKSFREISRETGITTPTVKSRFTRLVNVGFIKSVSPIFDLSTVEENKDILKPGYDKQQEKQQQENENIKDSTVIENRDRVTNNVQLSQQQDITRLKIKKGLRIKMDCEFCKGPIYDNPHVYRFANYERFFCCRGCMSGYKQKYAGRIESIKRKFSGKED